MPVMTPTTPLEAGVEMFERGQRQSLVAQKAEIFRPRSEATEFPETDFEDDDDDDGSSFEEDYSPKGSFESSRYDSRRRSETTISSYDEAPTPSTDSSRPFEIRFKPVEGPKGPHLFRASQSSVDFSLDFALQMSPLLPKEQPPRTETAFTEQTVTPVTQNLQQQSMPSMDSVLTGSPSHDVRRWSTEQVISWMYQYGIEAQIIQRFEDHDINGNVLMDLQFDNLKELDIHQFGKRHQIWNAISSLRGGEGRMSPAPTPFQDISRPCTSTRSKSDGDVPRSACPDTPIDNLATPISTAGGLKKRRARKNKPPNDIVTPAESVSIVAVEQLMPKPHVCQKGENCAKWRKQQRLIARIQAENGWPISPTNGGHIMISGNPGNASTAENHLPNVHRDPEPYRPVSVAVPSVVASSDVLGPGSMPEFGLNENVLQRVEHRDAQENVKQFLNLQHMYEEPAEEPATPPLEMFPPEHHEMFPSQHQQAFPSLQPPRSTPGPHEGLKSLPKLSIPRSASANPYMGTQSARIMSPAHRFNTGFTPSRSATASPGTVYRLGTPASEMDIPVTAIPLGPISRDTSQSVPPNMQYRDPSLHLPPPTRSASRAVRRPSAALPLPVLAEDRVFSPASDPNQTYIDAGPHAALPRPREDSARYGAAVTHAGWMKKRRNKLLRHEWTDAHFRLKGTQLAMHASARLSAAPTDVLDVDEYAVACSSGASNSKITAALRSCSLMKKGKEKGGMEDPAAFAFQLVPQPAERRMRVEGKTHHFAVRTGEERIDWMRELMLAKALRQKEAGYAVEVNGERA